MDKYLPKQFAHMLVKSFLTIAKHLLKVYAQSKTEPH